MSETHINAIVVRTTGHPRSGNNWVSQVLSDILSSPVDRQDGSPLTWFGGNTGKHILYFHHSTVEQLHNVPGYVVFVYRDPRAVAISSMFYKRMPLHRIIDTMVNGRAGSVETDHHGGYVNMVKPWWELHRRNLAHIRYEELYTQPRLALRPVLDMLDIDETYCDISAVMSRHTFDETCKSARQRLGLAPSASIHALRRGVPDDWTNYFDRDTGAMMQGTALGDLMIQQGYVENADWWKQLPTKVQQPCFGA